jgi:hypothetical protein
MGDNMIKYKMKKEMKKVKREKLIEEEMKIERGRIMG